MSDLTSDPTRAYHGGNPESTAAFESVSPEARKSQVARIVAWLRERGELGATCEEAELALGLSHQTCSARFVDAKKRGLIVRMEGVRRMTRTGRPAGVCRAKPR